jgi:hypothetical protein
MTTDCHQPLVLLRFRQNLSSVGSAEKAYMTMQMTNSPLPLWKMMEATTKQIMIVILPMARRWMMMDMTAMVFKKSTVYTPKDQCSLIPCIIRILMQWRTL